MGEALAGIVVIEEGVADQKAVETQGLRLLDLLQTLDAALDHFQAALGDFLDERHRLLPGRFPGVEVAAHGTDDVGPGFEGALQLGLGGGLHHYV